MITNKILETIEDNREGLTITELVNIIKEPRSTIRTELARLEGASKVNIRKIGMAKVYTLNQSNIPPKKEFKEKRISREEANDTRITSTFMIFILICTLSSIGILSAGLVRADFGSEDITLTSPETGVYYNETPQFIFTPVSFANATVQCQLMLNEESYGTIDATNNIEMTITPNNTLTDGAWDWYIKCESDTTIESEHRTITIDTTPPTIHFDEEITPQNGSRINQREFQIKMIYTDDNIALSKIEVYNEGAENIYYSEDTNVVTVSIDSDGYYYFNATITDLAGNVAYTETRVVYIDAEPPTIQYEESTTTDDSWIENGSIVTDISAADSSLSNITAYIYDENLNMIDSYTENSGTLSHTFTNLNTGTYYFDALAQDSSGNSARTIRRRVFNNVYPTAGYSSDTEVDQSFINRNNILINVSSEGANFRNLFLELYDSNNNMIAWNDSQNPSDTPLSFTDGLVNYYKMDETGGTAVIDSVGASNGIINGQIIYSKGKYGNSLNITPDGWVDLDLLSYPPVHGIGSVSMWVYIKNYPTEQGTILMKSDVTLLTNLFSIIISREGHLGYYVKGDYDDYTAMTENSVPLNKWVLLTMTADGDSNIKIYFDGVYQSTTTLCGGATKELFERGVSFKIGTYFRAMTAPPSAGVNLAIDELTFWNRSLRNSEITRLYDENGKSDIFRNYTNLGDGRYHFNATSYDIFGHSNSTTVRSIIIDTTSPYIAYLDSTEHNNSVISRNNIIVETFSQDNVSGIKNITIQLFDNNQSLIGSNQSIITDENTTVSHTEFLNIQNGEYYFNAITYDNAGNNAVTQLIHVEINSTNDIINTNSTTNTTTNSTTNTSQSTGGGSTGSSGGSTTSKSSGGSGGGSGGEYICSESWSCTDWTTCQSSGTQTRTCEDKNSCNTNASEPDTTKLCKYEAPKVVTQNTTSTNTTKKKALFDIILEILTEPTTSKKEFTAKITLINFGVAGMVDAKLHYTIKDEKGSVVREYDKVVPVDTQTQFIDTIDVSALADGKYSLSIDLQYEGQIYPAKTEKTFSIGQTSNIPYKIILGVIAVIILAGLQILFTNLHLNGGAEGEKSKTDSKPNMMATSASNNIILNQKIPTQPISKQENMQINTQPSNKTSDNILFNAENSTENKIDGSNISDSKSRIDDSNNKSSNDSNMREISNSNSTIQKDQKIVQQQSQEHPVDESHEKINISKSYLDSVREFMSRKPPKEADNKDNSSSKDIDNQNKTLEHDHNIKEVDEEIKLLNSEIKETDTEKIVKTPEKISSEDINSKNIVDKSEETIKMSKQYLEYLGHLHPTTLDIESTPDKYFILSDGNQIRTLRELKQMLTKMDSKTFHYHVNESRNDFANWARDVFGAEDIADRMMQSKNSDDIANSIFI